MNVGSVSTNFSGLTGATIDIVAGIANGTVRDLVASTARAFESHERMPADDLPVNPDSLRFVEALQARYVDDPDAVSDAWREYFESLNEGNGARRWAREVTLNRTSPFGGRLAGGAVASFQARVDQLVRAYRARGHIVADIDPLDLPRERPAELELGFHGLTKSDLAHPVPENTTPAPGAMTLAAVISNLRETYCEHIGVQYMHIDDLAARWWLRDRMESTGNRIHLEHDEQIRILTRLTDAVLFEEFIQKKYVGSKTFSLEGAESLIPLLDLALEWAGTHEIGSVVMGMAHRGRLNVLAHILGKSLQAIFSEFEDRDPRRYLGGGDVKYHLGHSAEWRTAGGDSVQISLCFNPSHLEFVNTVALGRVRANQDRQGDVERRHALPILIHGDAAFAGEGVVQETFNLSQLDAYRVGGTLHVVVNNQIGFTTRPDEGRSSNYATAVAKMLQIPILHVNGENPEAVARAVQLALEFRAEFQRDVVIDMYCYRRRGHNETDDASFTQPIMSRAIEEHHSVRDGYLRRLLALGEISEDEAQRVSDERRERLKAALDEVREGEYERETPPRAGVWDGYEGGVADRAYDVDTGVERNRLSGLLERLTMIPPDFRPHPRIRKFLQTRASMAAGERPLDWSAAEALAFASLVVDGYRVRMTGQDSARGTFGHRHSTLYDHEDGEPYRPFEHIDVDQAPVEIVNSPLSEAGVMGFEYGYSLECPDGLVLWEAQFGDFVNAAQVVLDQFVTSAEDKWRTLSGLVLLLPHGFEGMGPEHSSARLERFLMQSAEDNIQVVFPTEPSQIFHVLRRQALRRWRKPLVVMTPKSLLRHAKVTSSLDELESGAFRRVIPDRDSGNRRSDAVERIVLCSGKIYWELVAEREEREREEVPIIRVEELYPFPDEEIADALSDYPESAELVWVQEEPENMGAWRYMVMKLAALFPERQLCCVSRPESASPATGSASRHRLEQSIILAHAFGEEAADQDTK